MSQQRFPDTPGDLVATVCNNNFDELYASGAGDVVSAGKAGGQTVSGGTATGQDLTLRPNSANTTTGQVIINATTASTSVSTGSLKVLGGLGVAGAINAATYNKLVLTAPATAATLTIADGKTLTVSNTLTLTGTDASSVNLGAGGTVAYIPKVASGVGQWQVINTAAGDAAVLPSGGTWAAFITPYVLATGVVSGTPVATVATGGATIGAATGGITWIGFCWEVT